MLLMRPPSSGCAAQMAAVPATSSPSAQMKASSGDTGAAAPAVRKLKMKQV
jgi:hypothetical protein